jgi:hypothetical protein
MLLPISFALYGTYIDRRFDFGFASFSSAAACFLKSSLAVLTVVAFLGLTFAIVISTVLTLSSKRSLISLL